LQLQVLDVPQLQILRIQGRREELQNRLHVRVPRIIDPRRYRKARQGILAVCRNDVRAAGVPGASLPEGEEADDIFTDQ
jgi:hypothetical protein